MRLPDERPSRPDLVFDVLARFINTCIGAGLGLSLGVDRIPGASRSSRVRSAGHVALRVQANHVEEADHLGGALGVFAVAVT
jgi:hypothetical protein